MKKRYVVIPLAAAAWVLVFTRARRHGKFTLFDDINNAIDSIAHGNFNVRIDGGDHHPLSELTERLNKMARELGSLEAMRADFVGNVSHEIQSPLTSIGGFAKLLRESATDGETRHYADVIIAESGRLSSLSDNLLKLSTLDNNKIPLNKTDFRLDKQLQQVALTLEPQWSAKNIELSCELAPVTVNADAELLSQVWINLLNNAIKFTPPGGAITLTLADDAVTVADTGCGISDEDRLHIFERFYKVDRARDRSLGGSGLGLSIVKKILELHGYSITVESEVGRGTQFTIRLS
jgi:signal transduction histidine kinase